jgi:hypothetical protein
MGSPRQKYHLNYDMRKMWCPEFMKGPSVPPVYPYLEPELAIGRDWHSYRPIKEAWLMFGLGVGSLFGLAAVSTYDLTGYRARRPWVSAFLASNRQNTRNAAPAPHTYTPQVPGVAAAFTLA